MWNQRRYSPESYLTRGHFLRSFLYLAPPGLRQAIGRLRIRPLSPPSLRGDSTGLLVEVEGNAQFCTM